MNVSRGAGILVTGHMIFLLAAGWQENSHSRIDCSTGLNLACRLSCTTLSDASGRHHCLLLFESCPSFFSTQTAKNRTSAHRESLGISKLSTNDLSRLPSVLSKEERHPQRAILLLWGMNCFRSHLPFFSDNKKSLDNQLTSHLQRLNLKWSVLRKLRIYKSHFR